MKTLKNAPITILAMATLTVLLSACGTSRYSTSTSNASVTATATATSTYTNTYTYTETSTSTSTGTSVGTSPAYSYEFSAKGNQAVQTGAISTDGVLKVKFHVNAEQGNNVWKASELKVTLAVNGREFTPTYTSNNYTYGRVGEDSNVVDLSSYVTPGQSVTITAKSPLNDFYCTYWGGYNADGSFVNPQYNQYPGCRKAVFYNHTWSGVILVQTSSTVAI